MDRPTTTPPSTHRFAAMAAFLLFLTLLVLVASNSNHGGAVVAAGDPPPPAIFVLNLHDGPDSASLAFQYHDLSPAGFTDESGHWHTFPGLQHLIPTSTTLPFGSSYSDLVGGLQNLPGVPLGRKAMKEALRVLSAYDPTGADVEPVKRAMAVVKVMISEAQRLNPIDEIVGRGWDTESRVAPEHLAYIDHWDTMSYELLRAERTGKWHGPFTGMLKKSANISSKEDAVAVVSVLLNADFQQVLRAHANSI